MSCLPTARGYDTFQGYYLGSIDFYGHDNSEACCCNEVCSPGREFSSFNTTYSDVHGLKVDEGEYITDAIANAAISQIEAFDPSLPSSLFLTIAMAATHNGPFGDPQYKESDLDPVLKAKSPKRAGFSAMAKNLDDSVRAIYDALARKNILKDTLLVILSDNGGETSSGSSVYPFRGEKFTYFNGGIRAPAAILGAGVEGGETPGELFWIGDLTPTILEAVGAEIPRGLDGVSHWSSISGRNKYDPPLPRRTDPFVSGLDPVRRSGAVFYNQFKLVVNGTAGYDVDFNKPELGGWSPPDDADNNVVEHGVVEEVMLFDLQNDPEERLNLAGVDGYYGEVLKLCISEFTAVLESVAPNELQTKKLGGSLDDITPGVHGYGPWVSG